jgi:hypothetical protein
MVHNYFVGGLGVLVHNTNPNGCGASAVEIVQTAERLAPRLKAVMQTEVDKAVAQLRANPDLAKTLMTPGSYSHLVTGSGLAGASYGKAVERLVARNIRNDAHLNSMFGYQSRPFVSTPDFFGFDGQNMQMFDITTLGGVEKHMSRPYGPLTELILHPGLPADLKFNP